MATRLDISGLTPELIARLDNQVKIMGLKSRNEYFRLIMELDIATGIVQTLKEARDLKLKK